LAKPSARRTAYDGYFGKGRTFMKVNWVAIGIFATLAMPVVANAQGVVSGTQQGASQGAKQGAKAGNQAAGPVGGVVGGAVGTAVGGVSGGVQGALGTSSTSKGKPKNPAQ
jgi:hypothetical protein